MNELRLERALRAGPPFASPYRPGPLRLEPETMPLGSQARRLLLLTVVGLALASIAVLLTLGAHLITRPDPSPGPCPPSFDGANAVDTYRPGLTQAERAWLAPGSQPARPATANGVIAVFAWNLPDASQAIDTIDPTTARRCRLASLSGGYQLTLASVLDWSPGGDALAIGLDGQLLLWAPGSLLRIWTSDRYPHLAWSPDGASIAVWQGSMGDGGGVPNPGVRLIFADGRPDRTFELDPAEPGTMDLRWSPDGTRWVISRDTGIGVGSPSELRLVTVADGSETPLELGLPERTYHVVGWLDDEHVLVRASIYGPDPAQYHVVPVADPSAYTTLALRDEFAASSVWRPRFSPDLSRLVVSSSDIGLVVVDARSGERTTLGRDFGPEGVAWAPDSEQLVFQTDEGIFTIDATGTGRRQVATGSVALVGDPWQPEVAR